MKKQFYFLFLATSLLSILSFDCSATDPDTVTQQFIEKLQAQPITELPYSIFPHLFDTLMQEEEYYALLNSLSTYKDTSDVFLNDSIAIKYQLKGSHIHSSYIPYTYANELHTYSKPFFYKRLPTLMHDKVEAFITLTKVYADKEFRGIVLTLYTYEIHRDRTWTPIHLMIGEPHLSDYDIPHIEGFSIDENYYVKIGRHSNSEEYIVYSKETWFYDKCLPFFSPDWEKVDIDYNYDVYEFYPRDCED